MDSNTTSTHLSKFDELYSAATVAGGTPSNSDNSDIPDGEYAAIVEDVTLTNSPTSTPTIVWTFRIRGESPFRPVAAQGPAHFGAHHCLGKRGLD
jgi:hypothetical protein